MYVIGLGNPGLEYEKTRHNAGRILLEKIAKDFDFSDWKKDMKSNSLISHGILGEEDFVLVLPETFMNDSGFTVSKILNTEDSLSSLVVVYDDMDLPFGKIKISFNKSSGGHNGLSSIIKRTKSQSFVRIRIGVSFVGEDGLLRKPRGEEAVLKYLLGNFKKEEIDLLMKMSKQVSEVLISLKKNGKEITMTKFN